MASPKVLKKKLVKRKSPKKSLKKKMTTKGLKVGDTVDYNDGSLHLLGKVTNITSTMKAYIKAVSDVQGTGIIADLFKQGNSINSYRRYMKIVR